MKHLFVDIETFGRRPEFNPNEFEFDESKVRVGNLKDPQKIKEKIEKERKLAHKKQIEDYDKEWRKNALKSLNSDIICICYAIDDSDPGAIYIKNVGKVEDGDAVYSERDLVVEFDQKLKYLPVASTIVVAHNGLTFDFPFIRHRGFKYRLPKLVEMFSFSGRNDPRVRDTMEMWRGSDWKNYYHMDDIAKYLGFEGKDGVSGDMVHDMFLNREFDKIAEYCKNDVVQLRNIYYAMSKF